MSAALTDKIQASLAPLAAAATGDVPCCMGAAMFGWHACSCWEPVHDVDDQQTPHRDYSPGVMPARCSDCAFRHDSPERTGASHVAADQDVLEHLVASGQRFFCHSGARRIVAWVHGPTGVRFDLGESAAAAYDPPIAGGVPYRVDGFPIDVCRGWMGERLAHLRRTGDLPAGIFDCRSCFRPVVPRGAWEDPDNRDRRKRLWTPAGLRRDAGRGLCCNCYQRHRLEGTIDRFAPTGGAPGRCDRCGIKGPVRAGICSDCTEVTTELGEIAAWTEEVAAS